MHAYRKVAIVGVGLIGGSIGIGLRQRNLVGELIGVDRPSSLRIARTHGAIDTACEDLASALTGVELCIICTPVHSIAELAIEAMRFAEPGCLITDVGSTKRRIVKQVESSLKGAGESVSGFVGSHPLAGSAKSGAAFADPDLFVKRMVAVCPTEHSRAEDIERAESLWHALGASTTRLSPEDHDRAVAVTSHLPHIVAAVMASATSEDLLSMVGTGWQDTTRIASGDVEMWTQILIDNREFVLAAMDQFRTAWESMRRALHDADVSEISRELQQGKSRRDVVGS